MLFSATARRQPSLASSGAANSFSAWRVRDDQLAFGVGQQDRVGDGVDDAVEQHPLLPEARLGEQLAAQQPRDLLAERRAPARAFRHRSSGPTPLTSSRPWPGSRRPRRAAGWRGTAWPRAATRWWPASAVEVERHRAARAPRIRGWLVVVAVQREVHDRAAGDAVLGDEQHLVRDAGSATSDGRLADVGVRHEPVDGAARGFLEVDARQQKLDERELRVRIDPANRRGRRGGPCHWVTPSDVRRRGAGRGDLAPALLRRRHWSARLLFERRQLRAQRGVLRDDVLVRRQLRLRARHRRHLADRFRVLQVGVDRGDDDARFDGDQVDADERDADPGVDDDALVEHAVENVDETRAACGAFNCHAAAPAVRTAAAGAQRRLPRPRAAVSASTFRSSCRICARSSSCSASAPRAARPATGRGRTATSRGRSPAPCRENRRAAGCES